MSKKNHDLIVESKDFSIEVKYLKNWLSNSGTMSAKKEWKEFQSDFDWLEEEIKEGNKGKRAFIIGWFNCVDYFAQYMQLGTGKGSKPQADESKLVYFPFLTKTNENPPTYTKDLDYNYSASYEMRRLNLYKNYEVDCLFLGNESDKFHFAVYF